MFCNTEMFFKVVFSLMWIALFIFVFRLQDDWLAWLGIGLLLAFAGKQKK